MRGRRGMGGCAVNGRGGRGGPDRVVHGSFDDLVGRQASRSLLLLRAGLLFGGVEGILAPCCITLFTNMLLAEIQSLYSEGCSVPNGGFPRNCSYNCNNVLAS